MVIERSDEPEGISGRLSTLIKLSIALGEISSGKRIAKSASLLVSFYVEGNNIPCMSMEKLMICK
jgi:hypothetical protein